MQRLRSLLVAMALSVASVLAPVAHSADSALADIPTIGLVIEEMGSNAEACGITSEELETTVRFVLGQMGPRLTPKANVKNPWLYLIVNPADAGSHCFWAVRLELSVASSANHNRAYIEGIAWQKGGIGSARKSDAASRVQATVEKFAKAFAIAWKEHN